MLFSKYTLNAMKYIKKTFIILFKFRHYRSWYQTSRIIFPKNNFNNIRFVIDRHCIMLSFSSKKRKICLPGKFVMSIIYFFRILYYIDVMQNFVLLPYVDEIVFILWILYSSKSFLCDRNIKNNEIFCWKFSFLIIRGIKIQIGYINIFILLKFNEFDWSSMLGNV